MREGEMKKEREENKYNILGKINLFLSIDYSSGNNTGHNIHKFVWLQIY